MGKSVLKVSAETGMLICVAADAQLPRRFKSNAFPDPK
jgi:hypothetical protein